MKLKHNIAVAKNKSEDAECLGQHIHNLILEGQDCMQTIMRGDRLEIWDMLCEHKGHYRIDFNLEQSDKDIFNQVFRIATLSPHNEIQDSEKETFRNYFENVYLKHFLSMDAKSFFTYTSLITSVVDDLRERELTNYNFN